ncbi:hypothetical protein IHE44_0003993, partial [Lamprotornis superbus]
MASGASGSGALPAPAATFAVCQAQISDGLSDPEHSSLEPGAVLGTPALGLVLAVGSRLCQLGSDWDLHGGGSSLEPSACAGGPVPTAGLSCSSPLRRARALYACKAEHDSELSFTAGTVFDNEPLLSIPWYPWGVLQAPVPGCEQGGHTPVPAAGAEVLGRWRDPPALSWTSSKPTQGWKSSQGLRGAELEIGNGPRGGVPPRRSAVLPEPSLAAPSTALGAARGHPEFWGAGQVPPPCATAVPALAGKSRAQGSPGW